MYVLCLLSDGGLSACWSAAANIGLFTIADVRGDGPGYNEPGCIEFAYNEFKFCCPVIGFCLLSPIISMSLLSGDEVESASGDSLPGNLFGCVVFLRVFFATVSCSPSFVFVRFFLRLFLLATVGGCCCSSSLSGMSAVPVVRMSCCIGDSAMVAVVCCCSMLFAVERC